MGEVCGGGGGASGKGGWRMELGVAGGGALTRRAVTKSIPSNQTVDSEPNQGVRVARDEGCVRVRGGSQRPCRVSPSCLFSPFLWRNNPAILCA